MTKYTCVRCGIKIKTNSIPKGKVCFNCRRDEVEKEKVDSQDSRKEKI